MKYRMLAIDMDDTLLGQDLKISAGTVERIQKAKEKGVRVVIATGRMFQAIIPYLRQLELTDPAIVYNGAMVQRLEDEQPEVHHPVPVKLGRELANRVEDMDSQLNAYIHDQLFVRKRTPQVFRYMEATGVDSTEVGLLGEYLQQNPTKLLVIHDNLDEIEEMQQTLTQEFGEQLSIFRSKPNYIEVTAKGISKGKALAELAQKMGIDQSQVIAIGDSQNDLEMIKWAGLGVAVANARPEVKEVADFVTGSCEEDGVAQVIDRFIL